jgi:hypothetical protein
MAAPESLQEVVYYHAAHTIQLFPQLTTPPQILMIRFLLQLGLPGT